MPRFVWISPAFAVIFGAAKPGSVAIAFVEQWRPEPKFDGFEYWP
jgi:hypothetical protein